MPHPSSDAPGARALTDADLDRMVSIDRAHTGRTRRQFFAKRLEAARSSPQDYINIGVSRNGTLCGFVSARVLRGEFGREGAAAALDALGVDPECQGRGVGRMLTRELLAAASRLGVQSLHSQADWRQSNLLRFLAASGFELAPRLALDRSVSELLAEGTDEV